MLKSRNLCIQRLALIAPIFFSFTIVMSGCGTGGGISPGTTGPTATTAPPTTPDVSASDVSTIVQRHAGQITILAGTAAGSKAGCNQDEKMVGGGYYIAASVPTAAINSYPDNGGWVANVANTTTGPIFITAFADCLQTKASVTVEIVQSAPLSVAPPGSFAGSSATCPTGTVLTGGGYRVTPGFTGTDHLYALTPEPDGREWKVAGHFPGHTVSVVGYALCATHMASAPIVRQTLVIPGSTPAGAATGNCAGGALLTSGGFRGSDNDDMLYSIDSPDSVTAPSGGPITKWMLGGHNLDSTAHSVDIVGICVTVVP